MLKTVFAFAAAAIVVTAPIAAHAKAEPAPAPTEASVKASTHKRYCIVETRTESRIPLRTCKSRDQWLAEGFDPIAK